jgi:hypothetical protein
MGAERSPIHLGKMLTDARAQCKRFSPISPDQGKGRRLLMTTGEFSWFSLPVANGR